MHISIISGSTRAESQSRKVSDYLSKRLKFLKIDNSIIDLHEKRLPLYDDSETGEWKKLWRKISPLLQKSEGFIFVTPEWDGMFSVGIHNLIHYLDTEMADKAVLGVAVSSGRGGRYPLLQMRMMGYKNKRFVIIPESLFFEKITETLVDGKLTDARMIARTDYALKVLIQYSKALIGVRKSGVLNYEKFENGL